jgi:hypothetical protein
MENDYQKAFEENQVYEEKAMGLWLKHYYLNQKKGGKMSTRGALVREVEKGKIQYSYNHSDSYPSVLGFNLKNILRTKADVNYLFSLGDSSFIGKSLEESSFYCRDYDDDFKETHDHFLDIDISNTDKIVQEVADTTGAEYFYFIYETPKNEIVIVTNRAKNGKIVEIGESE